MAGMKRIYKYIFIGLAVILISGVVMSMYYYSRIKMDYKDEEFPPGAGNNKYHFSLIINNSESMYWRQFKQGALDAAEEFNVALEYHGIESADDLATTKMQMRIAVASCNDGVIVNTLDEETYLTDIGYLVDHDLAVLTTGIEARSNDSFYVGTNAYAYGQEAARLVIQSAGEDARIAVIVDDTVSYGDDVQDTNKIAGFSKEIQAYPDAKIVTIKKTSSHLLGAEDVVQFILDGFPQVNAIFCMTPEDTMAAAQAIIDRNRVGEIVVTGTDLSVSPSVEKYIEKNIIYGYIERNPYDIGYQSVATLCNVVEGKFQPAYEDIDMDIVTKYNIDQYQTDEDAYD